MKVCAFAGTFDPITNGHVYVIEKCLECFDKVVVAVGINQDKKPLFDIEKRKDIIKNVFKDNDRVEVKEFDGLLVDFLKKEEIKINVRGIRDEVDYKYETKMSRFNLDMFPEIITVYIPTPSQLVHVSSSAVRNIMSYGQEPEKYLPSPSLDAVKEKLKMAKE